MYKKILFYFLAPLLVLFPAFYNGYPLVYSDSGTYISSGMELLIPNDRPILYGLFIRIFSLGFSLWLVIYMQALISFYCLFELSKLVFKQLSKSAFLLLLFPLSLFSGLSWYSSQIMPDIFTFCSFASLVLLLFAEEDSKLKKAIFSIIFLFSVQVHFSNFLISLAILIAAFIIQKSAILETPLKLKFRLIFILFILSFALSSSINFGIGSSFKISRGSHVFLMGKMLDSGVLKSFLDDKCEANNYSLCQYKDSLPLDSRTLLWGEDSPLQKEGGWQATEQSYRKILLGIFTSPKHLLLYCYNSTYASLSQLVQIDLGSGLESSWYRDSSSPPYIQIEKHFHLELNPYLQARQNGNLWKQELNVKAFNLVYKGLLFLSIAFILWIMTRKNRKEILDSKLSFIFLAIILLNVFNAIVSASLANVYDRLQARITWLLIWFVLIVLLSKWKELKRDSKEITL